MGRVLGPAEDSGDGTGYINPNNVRIVSFNRPCTSSVASTSLSLYLIVSGSSTKSMTLEQRDLINLKSAVPSRTGH